MTLQAPAVKLAALQLGLEIHQPAKIKKPPLADWVAAHDVDVALVMAYGRILSQAVLDAPRRGCMNLHASLLPKYRGAAPINWAIVDGEQESGVCLMQMDAGMDTGPVLSRHAIPIGPDETAGELAERIAALAALVVRSDLQRAVASELEPTAQDHDQATLARLLDKQDGRVDWNTSATRVHDHIRGMTPWPGAFTTLRGKALKILRARVAAGESKASAGTVVIADRNAVIVACGSGLIELMELQLAGKKAVAAGDMVNGRSIAQGDTLGGGST
jgi:methionyl-tRNA formyltransferase